MLTIKNLSKRYKKSDVMAVNEVSFSVQKGEIVGMIGGNGAGKTTIMKAIAKSVHPTEGEIYIDGKNINLTNNALKDASIMIEPVFYTHISAYQNIEFYLKINDLNASEQQIKQVMELVGLWVFKDKKPSTFSFGMKQRLGLAMCLASQPKMVIMDEPFVGLDPNGVSTLIEHLKKWAKSKNMAMLISSHQLSELESLCDRYLYIENGKLKKSFDLQSMNTTVLYLREDLTQDFTRNYPNTILIDDKTIKTNLSGEELGQLIADISHINIIVKIEKDDYLHNIFKGEI